MRKGTYSLLHQGIIKEAEQNEERYHGFEISARVTGPGGFAPILYAELWSLVEEWTHDPGGAVEMMLQGGDVLVKTPQGHYRRIRYKPLPIVLHTGCGRSDGQSVHAHLYGQVVAFTCGACGQELFTFKR